MASMVRVCAVQYEMKSIASFEDFAGHCRYLASVVAGYGADFAVFPEMLTCQLLQLTPGLTGAAALKALSEHTGRFVKLFTGLAVEFKVNLIGGANFTLENGKAFNIATLFRRDGTTGRQFKIHATPGEKNSWGISAGDAIEVFDTDKGKVAINICYDVEFPELARLAVERGARILFVPFCTDDRRGFLRVRYCAQARCVENQIYVVTAGVVGNLRGVPDMDVHYAASAVLTPSDHGFARDGIAAECEPNLEGVAVADVDLGALEHARLNGTVKNWEDRRTDLYEVRRLR